MGLYNLNEGSGCSSSTVDCTLLYNNSGEFNKIKIFVQSDEVDKVCVLDLGANNKETFYQGTSNERLFQQKRQLPFETSDNGDDSRKGNCHKYSEILLEVFTLLFTAVDMVFVGILVYRHYTSEETKDPLQAWAMLLPILLSTFGVQLFFEKYPPERHWYNEFLNIPLMGPIFCTGHMLYAKLWCVEDADEIRVEAESIKLKQYESIFRAFPEGVVMLTVLLIHQKEEQAHHLQSWMMEMICIAFAIIGLAECHWYGIVSDFYRLHDKGRPSPFNHEDRKRPHKLRVWQKLALFLHAIFAIGLRVLCEGLIRATVYFAMNRAMLNQRGVTPPHSLAEILLIVFFGETFVRSVLHLSSQLVSVVSTDIYKYLMNPFFDIGRLGNASGSPRVSRNRRGYGRIDTRLLDGTTDDGDEEFIGIHGAVKHGLLASFSPLQFQSKYLPTVLWFYTENLTFLLVWFVYTRKCDVGSGSSTAFVLYDKLLLSLAFFLFIMSVALQALVTHIRFPNSEMFVVRLRRVLHSG